MNTKIVFIHNSFAGSKKKTKKEREKTQLDVFLFNVEPSQIRVRRNASEKEAKVLIVLDLTSLLVKGLPQLYASLPDWWRLIVSNQVLKERTSH